VRARVRVRACVCVCVRVRARACALRRHPSTDRRMRAVRLSALRRMRACCGRSRTVKPAPLRRCGAAPLGPLQRAQQCVRLRCGRRSLQPRPHGCAAHVMRDCTIDCNARLLRPPGVAHGAELPAALRGGDRNGHCVWRGTHGYYNYMCSRGTHVYSRVLTCTHVLTTRCSAAVTGVGALHGCRGPHRTKKTQQQRGKTTPGAPLLLRVAHSNGIARQRPVERHKTTRSPSAEQARQSHRGT
jgi:hypothetical protein